MKKRWWILPVALLVTGSLLLAGCGGKKKTTNGPDPDEFDKVMLGDFNTWGGDPAKQSGWGTTGFTWDDDSVTPKKEGAVVEDKGYKLDDFQKAKYLVLKLKSGQPAGGVQFIWGGSGATEEESTAIGGWHQADITSNSGVATASMGATKEDDELTIELSKAFKDEDYGKYLDAKTTAVRLIVAYYTGAGLADLFDEAWLLVGKEKPEEEPELPPPETAAIYTAKDGWISGVSATGGTHTTNTGYAVEIDVSGAKPEFEFTITFSPDYDISKIVGFEAEWDGVHPEFKQMAFNLDIFTSDGKQTQAQTTWKEKTDVGYTFGEDIQSWGNNEDWPTNNKLSSLKLYCNFMQSGEWANISNDDDDIEDFVLKSFAFVLADD